MSARGVGFSCAALVLLAAAVRAGDVAIVVHPENKQTAFTALELTRLFRLDQQHWKSGEKVDLVLQVGSAKEPLVADRVFRMKTDELKPFWLGKIFRGELTSSPRTFASDLSVRQYVGANARALGYIDAVLLDDTVKAVRVDGKLPGEPGYLLAREVVTPPPARPGAGATSSQTTRP